MPVSSFEPTAEAVWAGVIERAKTELPDSSFSMWFSDVRPGQLQEGVLELLAPSDYVRDWLARHYMDLIQRGAQEAAGRSIRVHLVAERLPAREPEPERAPGARQPAPADAVGLGFP